MKQEELVPLLEIYRMLSLPIKEESFVILKKKEDILLNTLEKIETLLNKI
jgi:hypothetical protein